MNRNTTATSTAAAGGGTAAGTSAAKARYLELDDKSIAFPSLDHALSAVVLGCLTQLQTSNTSTASSVIVCTSGTPPQMEESSP